MKSTGARVSFCEEGARFVKSSERAGGEFGVAAHLFDGVALDLECAILRLHQQTANAHGLIFSESLIDLIELFNKDSGIHLPSPLE